MAVVVRITDKQNQVREVQVESGKELQVKPGEKITVVGVDPASVLIAVQGNDVAMAIGDGQPIVLKQMASMVADKSASLTVGDQPETASVIDTLEALKQYDINALSNFQTAAGTDNSAPQSQSSDANTGDGSGFSIQPANTTSNSTPRVTTDAPQAAPDNATDAAAGGAAPLGAAVPVNTPPVAVDDALTIGEDGKLTIATTSLLANDFDANGDSLSLSSFDGSQLKGTLVKNADGTMTYDPGNAFQYLAKGETATETFTYQIDDGRGGTSQATVTITIVGSNDGPTISAANLSGAVTENGGLASSGTIAFNDVDLTDGHTVSIASTEGNLGSLTASVSEKAGAADGSVSWSYSVDDAA
ncbi:hypothetical protein CU669_20215, partial [Paramagnetospirillum kuznetsovii]